MSHRGSAEDVFKQMANPKYEFHGQDIPKGSAAFQMVITDFSEKEKAESDSEDHEPKRPSREYMNRRRNTVGGPMLGFHVNFPEHFQRGRRGSSVSPGFQTLAVGSSSSRARSISPMARDLLKKHNIRTDGLAFGSKTERDTVLH